MHLKHKRQKVNFVASMILFIILACFPVLDVYAVTADEWYGEDKPPYSSWVTDSVDAPNFEEYEPDESIWDDIKTFSIDSITKHMAKNIMNLGVGINRIMYSGDNFGNITIEGLVLGRLSERTWDFSVAQFGLEEGNPYGVVGAHVYVILRNVIYGFFLVYACWLLVMQGFQNSSKAWLSLKEGVMGIVFAFFLTYLMPQLTSAFLVIRDGLMVSVSGEFSGVANTSSSLNAFYVQQYIDEPDNALVTAILFLALQFANLYFIGSYVTFAVQSGMLFGMFPAVAIISLKQKKILSDWCATFFSNLAVPLIDYILLIIPTQIGAVTGTTNYVTAIITLFVVWNVIPARNAVLRLFGNATGTNAGRGMAGIGAMGMMAMRMMMMRGGGGKGAAASSGGNEGFFGNLSNAKAAQNETAALGNSLSVRGAEMQEVDKLMSSSGTEHSHASFAPAIDSLERDEASAASASASVSASASGSADNSADINAEVEAAASASGGGSFTYDEGVAPASGESYDVPAGAMDEDVMVASGMPVNGSVDMNSMDMDGLSASGTGTMNAGSMSDIDMESLKPQDVNMTFDDMRLRNLENMESTQSRIHELETALPQAQETVSAFEKANAADNKTITNADKIFNTNNETISELTKQNTGLKDSLKEGTKYTAQDRVQVEKQIKENTQKIQQLRSENTEQILRKESAEKAIAARMPEYQKAQAAYEHHTTQLSAAKAAYGKQTMIERNFANAREISGGSGKVYESAAQFRDTHAMSEIRKKNMNYRNFDMGDNARLLSPQEKADFYRQRAVVQASKKMVGTAGMLTAGAVGATVGMYGGAGSTMMGAVVGGIAGNASGKYIGENSAVAATELKKNAPVIKDKIVQTANSLPLPKTAPKKPDTNVVKESAPLSSDRASRLLSKFTSNAEKGKGQTGDVFEEHIKMARAGDAELNAARGKKMILHSDGKDTLQDVKKE